MSADDRVRKGGIWPALYGVLLAFISVHEWFGFEPLMDTDIRRWQSSKRGYLACSTGVLLAFISVHEWFGS